MFIIALEWNAQNLVDLTIGNDDGDVITGNQNGQLWLGLLSCLFLAFAGAHIQLKGLAGNRMLNASDEKMFLFAQHSHKQSFRLVSFTLIKKQKTLRRLSRLSSILYAMISRPGSKIQKDPTQQTPPCSPTQTPAPSVFEKASPANTQYT